jgi:hypothetical protein
MYELFILAQEIVPQADNTNSVLLWGLGSAIGALGVLGSAVLQIMRERIKTAEDQIKVLMEDAKTHQDDLVRLVKEMAAVHAQTGTVLVTLSNNMEQLTAQLRSLEVAIIRMEGKPVMK